MKDRPNTDPKYELYKSASYVMAGCSCLVMVLSMLFFRLGEGNKSILPGFAFIAGLGYFVLSAWVGILCRRLDHGKWWVHAILLVIAIVCVYFYRHSIDNWWWNYARLLCLAMAVFGYLIPPGYLEEKSSKSGWNELILASMAAFCYAVISIAKHRLLRNDVMTPRYADMQNLIEILMVNAEPLMAIIAVYFVIGFSFSRTALTLGSRPWVHGILWIPCIILFVKAVGDMFEIPWHYPWFSFVKILVQPCFVYLVIVAVRAIGKASGKNSLSWKEIFLI